MLLYEYLENKHILKNLLNTLEFLTPPTPIPPMQQQMVGKSLSPYQTFILSVTFQKIVNPWISLLSSLAHKVFFITLLHFATLKKAKLDLLFFI